jgi:hypothetical protein
VVWRHTEYHEETRAATTRTRRVRRLVRHWPADLRDVDWKTVAPLPLTADQARALLPRIHEYADDSGAVMLADVGDGTLSYHFDEKGRTVRVGWDPSADSSDFEYRYQYTCSPAPSRRDLPRHEE